VPRDALKKKIGYEQATKSINFVVVGVISVVRTLVDGYRRISKQDDESLLVLIVPALILIYLFVCSPVSKSALPAFGPALRNSGNNKQKAAQALGRDFNLAGHYFSSEMRSQNATRNDEIIATNHRKCE